MKAWEQFEQDVAQISEALGKESGAELIGYGRNCKVQGKSGLKRQIDVLMGIPTPIGQVSMAISCKDWKTRVDVQEIDDLWAVMEDTGIKLGAVASRKGFTAGAKQSAEYRSIFLLRLDDPDWEGRIQTIVMQINFSWPHVDDFHVIWANPKESDQDPNKGTVETLGNVMVITPGEPEKSLGDVVQESISDVTEGEIEINFPRDTQLFSRTVNKGRVAKGVRFRLRTFETTKEVVVDGSDHVAKVLENLTTGQRFVVDPQGGLKETPEA